MTPSFLLMPFIPLRPPKSVWLDPQRPPESGRNHRQPYPAEYHGRTESEGADKATDL